MNKKQPAINPKKAKKKQANILQEQMGQNMDKILLEVMKQLLTFPEFKRYLAENYDVQYLIDEEKKVIHPHVVKTTAIENVEKHKIVLAK